MNVSFSTTGKHEAKERFAHEKFAWLSQAAKDYILENLGDMRVQCTMMYSSPQIEFHGDRIAEHHAMVMKLLTANPTAELNKETGK